MAEVEESIKEAVKKKRIVIGSRCVIKEMKRSRIGMVAYASNAPENLRSDLGHYSGVSGIDVRAFKGDSAKLGGLCGKPFHILAVGVKK